MGASYLLLVEDDDAMREILAAYMRRDGREVCTAPDAASALELMTKRGAPTAILSDVRMPGVLGTDLADYLRTSRALRGVPVAFVTAAPELAPPDYTVFPKPVRLRDVLHFVERCERHGGQASEPTGRDSNGRGT